MRHLLALCVLAALAVSCHAGDAPVAPTGTGTVIPPAEIVEIARGGSPDASAPEVVVARDEKEWQALVSQLGSGPRPAHGSDVVDWKTQMAVAIVDAERPTAGWRLEVAKGERRGDDLVLTIRAKRPEGIAAQVLTRPYVVVRVPRVPGKVTVEREK